MCLPLSRETNPNNRYASAAFDISHIPHEDVELLPLLSTCMTSMGVAARPDAAVGSPEASERDYLQFNEQVTSITGGIGAAPWVAAMEMKDPREALVSREAGDGRVALESDVPVASRMILSGKVRAIHCSFFFFPL